MTVIVMEEYAMLLSLRSLLLTQNQPKRNRLSTNGPVRYTPAILARTLQLINGGGLVGRLRLVLWSVQVGVFGRSLAAS